MKSKEEMLDHNATVFAENTDELERIFDKGLESDCGVPWICTESIIDELSEKGYIISKVVDYEEEDLTQQTAQLQQEVERLKGVLWNTKNALSKATGLLNNIRHETDYMPDSYYEWIDRVLNETGDFEFTEEEWKEITSFNPQKDENGR